MGFMDEVSKYNRPANMCKIRLFLDNQNKEELRTAGFSTTLTDADIREAHAKHTIKAVLQALKDRGFSGGDTALASHLKNLCTCARRK